MPSWAKAALAVAGFLVFGCCAWSGVALLGGTWGRDVPHARVPIAPPGPAVAPTQPENPQVRAWHERAEAMSNAVGMRSAVIDWVNSATPLDYGMIMRDPERYRGTEVWFPATIIQIDDVAGRSMLLVAVAPNDDVVHVESLGLAAHGVVARSDVYVAGVLMGTFSYQTVAGLNVTVPEVLGIGVIPKAVANPMVRGLDRTHR